MVLAWSSRPIGVDLPLLSMTVQSTVAEASTAGIGSSMALPLL
jgi:hypothetical protein